MRTRSLLVVALLVVFIFVALVPAFCAPAAPKGGGKGGPRPGSGWGNMLYIERVWSAAAFELNASADQLAKLRPTLQQCWKTRKAAMDKARQSRDMNAMGTAMTKIKATIDAKLKQVLSKQQMAAWLNLQKQYETRRPR